MLLDLYFIFIEENKGIGGWAKMRKPDPVKENDEALLLIIGAL
jgi:hypothetical protein